MMISLQVYGGHFDVEKKKHRLQEIVEMESMDGFWTDTENASKIQKERSILEDVVSTYVDLQILFDDFETLVEFVE